MSEKKNKERLDLLVLEQHPELSRNQVQSFIMQGAVSVDGVVINKPGTPVARTSLISVTNSKPPYVSRAGLKLEAALREFNIDVTDKIALDAGISTGGFTDCLLQHGAARVYGADVAYGQVHESISSDKRVVLLEKTNVRHLDRLPELVDIITLDLSFISLLKVIPAVSQVLKPDGKIITLIKPQFEADRKDISRGGIVKDDAVHQKVIDKIITGMKEFGFESKGVIESPITGATAGNKEFLALFTR